MSFTYSAHYDSSGLRGKDKYQRPWDLTNLIISHAGERLKLLDIGCGTAFKLVSLAPHFREIIGIDISESMIIAVNITTNKSHIKNIKFVHGDSFRLPFHTNTFDMVTCILSIWDLKEIVRVLKPNGVIIAEHIGCEDKKDFKVLFGKDEDGWRGQFLNYRCEEYLKSYRNMFNAFFETVSIENGFWETHYTKQGLLELLQLTPTIRNFNLINDNDVLQEAYEIFNSSQGIVLTQNRILIHAQHPRIFKIQRLIS